MQNEFFTPFDVPITDYLLPEKFTCFFDDKVDNKNNHNIDYQPHKLCLLATKQLQKHLTYQQEWTHNFGLEKGQQGNIIGKMFGVLIVITGEGEIGFLSAFSGKLAGSNHHKAFVPPVFDMLVPNGFLGNGMKFLTNINLEIKQLEENKESEIENNEKINILKKIRKENSIILQDELFEAYHFVNQAGVSKSLKAIFRDTLNTSPPSGAGECAAPKLLQYAFQNQMQPLAIAEFWWGLSPKSSFWQHQYFYPACREKCMPILSYMLSL